MAFWWRMIGLLMMIAVVFALLFVFLFSTGCPATSYQRNYSNPAVVAPPKRGDAKPTPAGILLIVKKASKSFAELGKTVDNKTTELEACLQKNKVITEPIRRKWFGVYIPKSWYVSKCSKQQMIPSHIDYRLCEQKKLCKDEWVCEDKKICDKNTPPKCVTEKQCMTKKVCKPVKIEEECRKHTHPTELCPCPCNVRSSIHYNFWIVTTPDFRLFKAELARLVTGQNNPWANKKISSCLK